jgi:hypothetical protein
MIQKTIGILQRAADLGLKLGFEEPDTLTYEPIENCPCDFRETLHAYKPQLLALLALSFVMVFSTALGETVFFCQDETTKWALCEAGAGSFAVYTRDELRILSEANRIAPLSADELRKVHQIKRIFGARIAPE